MIWVVFGLMWVACGIYATGTTFAHFQGEFPTIAKEGRREDLGFAIAFGLLGPIGAIVSLLSSGFNEHGWRLK